MASQQIQTPPAAVAVVAALSRCAQISAVVVAADAVVVEIVEVAVVAVVEDADVVAPALSVQLSSIEILRQQCK